MSEHKQSSWRKRSFIILALIVGLWTSACTRLMGQPGKDARPDEGNRDIEIDIDVNPLEASSLTDGTVDASQKDASAKVDTNQRDIGSRDGGTIPGTWVTISAGTFTMGSPLGEACREIDETQHQVTLTHSFEIQTTEVTQSQFQVLIGNNPSKITSCGGNCPVEQVNWHDAANYCNALSTIAGYVKCYDCLKKGSSITCSENASFASGNIYQCPGYRLPTEAEWEYAYRAGSSTSLYNNTNVVNCSASDPNSDAVSWNYNNSSSTTHAVGLKPANNWGLYDMAGNVWEWQNDWWDGTTAYDTASVTDPCGQSSASNHILRGGAWFAIPGHNRAAYRYDVSPTSIGSAIGFRCVRTN